MPLALNPVVERSDFAATIGEIYAAVENPTLWPVVLTRIAGFVASENVLLFANYQGSIADDIHAMFAYDPGVWEPYREHYASVNVWTEHCDKVFPPGTIRYSHRAISDGELQKTEFYADFLRPNGMAYGFGIEIALPDMPPALLSALRSSQAGPFEESEGRILEALLPHLQRALRLHREITLLRSAYRGFEQALDAFERAVFGADGTGRILFSNQAAGKLVAQEDGLSIHNKHLVASLPAQNAELKSLLREAAVSGAGFSRAGATLVNRKSGKPPFRLTFMPYASNLLRHIPALTTLIFVDDPTVKASSRSAVLRALFRLSPTEARLVDLLASGASLAEASESLKMSAETARFHLKSIFRKTGVNRQVELVRLALRLPVTCSPCI